MADRAGANTSRTGQYAHPPTTSARRLSYASVASGAISQAFIPVTRSGAYSHLVSTTPSSSYPPPYYSDYRHPRRQSGQEQEVPNNISMSYSSSWKQPSSLPAYSRKYSGVPGFGSAPPSAFFIPSYLQQSRYAAKLEAAHKAKVRAQRERPSAPCSSSSFLPNNPDTNILRITPSHRGMTYDIIESQPTREEDQLTPLPSRLSETEKHAGLDVTLDGRELKYNGSASKSDHEAASIRTDYPMSPACGIYYYEVKIKEKSKNCDIAIGFSTTKPSLERLPGWEPESWAWHGDDGRAFRGESTGRNYGSPFQPGDIIGCAINFNTNQSFFTKNGNHLGVAFTELKPLKYFPCIGLKRSSGAYLSVNFGQQPFTYDIDERMREEEMKVDDDIYRSNASRLCPPMDEGELIQQLIAQFLAHDGYVETAEAFAQDIRSEKRALQSTATAIIDNYPIPDNSKSVHRQQIRKAVLDGDIESALAITNKHFVNVLEQAPKIVFRLKCRKWIELISKAADLRRKRATSTSTSSAQTRRRSSNGLVGNKMPSSGNVEDVFDQDMELDEDHDTQAVNNPRGNLRSSNIFNKSPSKYTISAPGMREDENLHSLPSTPDQSSPDGGIELHSSSSMEYDEILSQAMEYGQLLQREFRDEEGGNGDTKGTGSGEYKKTLAAIFSLVAYDDPRESPHGHLLDMKGRSDVAEELNAAILVSLGKSPSAALEKMFKQTDALLDVLSVDGGPAPFVNLKTRFEEPEEGLRE